jgi:tol-pal system protein YbgF
MRAIKRGVLGLIAAGLMSAAVADPFDDAPAPANRAQAIQAESQRQSGDLSDDSGTRVAGLFGKSDEEIAAEQAAAAAARQHEQTQDSNIATLTQKNADLEQTVQRLTGQNETLSHRVDEFESKIAKMQKDFDYRICMLAQQQLASSSDDTATTDAPPAPAINCASMGSTASAPPPDAQVYGAGNPVSLPGPPPAAGSRQQFDNAMRLLAKAQYDEARSAFQGIVDANPDDEMAPQAVYWIGDIAYVQRDYQSAARSFAMEIKKYPSSDRAPESMLKLGQSLIAMGKKEEGCTTLGALKEKYPQSAATTGKKATAARKAASCH